MTPEQLNGYDVFRIYVQNSGGLTVWDPVRQSTARLVVVDGEFRIGSLDGNIELYPIEPEYALANYQKLLSGDFQH